MCVRAWVSVCVCVCVCHDLDRKVRSFLLGCLARLAHGKSLTVTSGPMKAPFKVEAVCQVFEWNASVFWGSTIVKGHVASMIHLDVSLICAECLYAWVSPWFKSVLSACSYSPCAA